MHCKYYKPLNGVHIAELQINMEAKKCNVQAIILNNILNIKLTSVSPVVHLSKPQPHNSIFHSN